MTKSEWILGLAFVCALAALPLAGHWARRGAARSCDFDGAAIDPIYRVRIVDADGKDREFCCIGCAEQWLGRTSRQPRAILVTDEIGGETLDAAAAFFAHSRVVTQRTTGNRIHAFRTRGDAEHHAATVGGRVLDGTDRPFR
jgi:hypothetical protein